MEVSETPGLIPINSEPEHEIVFEENEDDPDIEPLFDYLKDGESNSDTWNVFDDLEVDTKVDINKPIVTRSGRMFVIQEFNINQIEYPWFDEINTTYK